MQTVKTNNAEIPVLGLGTWMLSGSEARQITEKALQAGYTHLDTAQMYSNEKEIGEAVRASEVQREKLFITTKIWWENLSEEKFMPSVERSLEKLGIQQLDLLLIHWPHPSMEPATYLERLMKAQEKGLTKHIGISNFTPALVEKAVGTGANIVNNQVEYHPFLDQSSVLDTCRQHGISITAYAPLARGRVTEEPTIVTIAEKYGKTPAQVALRWLIQQPLVIAIPKTSTPSRLKENADIFDFELTEEEMNKIHSLTGRENRLVNPEFAPQW